MEQIIVRIAAFFCLSHHISGQQPNLEDYIQATIVNGEPVDGASYPWMASLRSEYPGYVFDVVDSTIYYERFCGGVCIQSDPIVILTAAHCVELYGPSIKGTILEFDEFQDEWLEINLYVDLGRTKNVEITNDYNETLDVFHTINIASFDMIHIHPNWNTDFVEAGFDIALIVVDDGQTLPMNFTIPNIPRANLRASESCCNNREVFTALGYGDNEDAAEGGGPTDTLEQTTMQYYSSDTCNELLWTALGHSLPVPGFVENIPNNQVCTMGDNTDICTGDSGGPLFRINDGTVEIVGIASYVMSMDDNGFDRCNSLQPTPSFFTSVAHYVDWIRYVIPDAQAPTLTPTRSPTEVESIAPSIAPIAGTPTELQSTTSRTPSVAPYRSPTATPTEMNTTTTGATSTAPTTEIGTTSAATTVSITNNKFQLVCLIIYCLLIVMIVTN
eukprot:188126_1